MRYYGHYSNVARARCSADDPKERPAAPPRDEESDITERRQARRAWAHLIRRVYEVDPLICRECGGEMRILAFLLEPVAIRKIHTHLARWARRASSSSLPTRLQDLSRDPTPYPRMRATVRGVKELPSLRTSGCDETYIASRPDAIRDR